MIINFLHLFFFATCSRNVSRHWLQGEVNLSESNFLDRVGEFGEVRLKLCHLLSCICVLNMCTEYWVTLAVPGRDACEISMVHQEDAGLNAKMARVAFSRGIWNYICKMDAALRKYSSVSHGDLSLNLSTVKLDLKVRIFVVLCSTLLHI